MNMEQFVQANRDKFKYSDLGAARADSNLGIHDRAVLLELFQQVVKDEHHRLEKAGTFLYIMGQGLVFIVNMKNFDIISGLRG